jgi:hypothetical protein
VQDMAPTRSPLTAADGDALSYVGYFAELIDECSPENDASEPLFRLSTSIVEAMIVGVPLDALARYFEFWLLRLQGVYRADPSLSAGARAFLSAARACSPLALGEVPISAAIARELERVHQVQIAMHLEKDLKSLKVLREIRRT